MVNSATLVAVSASISTPVRPTVSEVAVHVTLYVVGSVVKSTVTRVSGIGWQSGMSAPVCLAAMMPAKRAIPKTSPFAAVPSESFLNVAACMVMRPWAMARRCVSAFAETSTMCAWPAASKCVR